MLHTLCIHCWRLDNQKFWCPPFLATILHLFGWFLTNFCTKNAVDAAPITKQLDKHKKREGAPQGKGMMGFALQTLVFNLCWWFTSDELVRTCYHCLYVNAGFTVREKSAPEQWPINCEELKHSFVLHQISIDINPLNSKTGQVKS